MEQNGALTRHKRIKKSFIINYTTSGYRTFSPPKFRTDCCLSTLKRRRVSFSRQGTAAPRHLEAARWQVDSHQLRIPDCIAKKKKKYNYLTVKCHATFKLFIIIFFFFSPWAELRRRPPVHSAPLGDLIISARSPRVDVWQQSVRISCDCPEEATHAKRHTVVLKFIFQ